MKIIQEGLKWMVIKDEKVVSSLLLSTLNIGNGEEGYVIRNVITDPDYRNQGLASKLYEEAFNFIRENNYRLFRGSHLDSTNSFYKKNGISFKPSNLESNEYKEECVFK